MTPTSSEPAPKAGTPAPDWRSLASRAAAALALVALAWAFAVILTGGIRLHVGGSVISSRDAGRPAALAVILWVVALGVARARCRTAPWVWLRARVERASAIVAIAAAGAVLFVGLAYGARAVSGADTFGYVSQAYLWLKGDLHIPQPLAGVVPWPYPDESLSPLGYRPGALRRTIVPTYPPGLPLLMAGFHLAFGIAGPYYVAPVFGALLVVLTFWLALRLTGDRLTGALAALFMACSPAFLFNLMLPMSDIVAAALWIGALLLLTWPGTSRAAAAGCVAGLATLVRPNLAPLALAGMLAAELWDRGPARRRGIRAIAFLSGVLPAAGALLFINSRLHGSALLSGYGAASSLYDLGYWSDNLRRYPAWLLESQSPAVLIALLPLLFAKLRPSWLTLRTALPCGVFVLILVLSYLFYLPFDAWWYLRFLLAAFPLLFILVAAPLAGLTRAAPAPIATIALVSLVALLVGRWTGYALDRRVLDLGSGEQRYVAVAEFIERELPENAMVIAYQHSGTIRYYSGRMTMHHMMFTPGRLPTVIEWLDANGYRPYILLEHWEEEGYRRRFASQGPLGRLEIPVIAESTAPVPIRLYDPIASPGSVAPVTLPVVVPDERRVRGPRGPWGR